MSPVHIQGRPAGFQLHKFFSLPNNADESLLCNLARGLEMHGSPPASVMSLPNLEDIELPRGNMDSTCSSSPQPSPGKSLPPSPSSSIDYLDEREPGHEPTFGLLDEHMAPVDVYSCDDFRMFEFKVRRCMRGRSHDWTECPFAHPGEKARRRDPRKSHYSGTACPDFRKGTCRRGDACEYAHGVFECWLHPARYRTQACKDGVACKRRVCFFAHTREQLRVLPAGGGAGTGTGAAPSVGGGMGVGSASVSSCSGQSLVSPRSASRCCVVNSSSVRSEGKGATGDLAGQGTAGGGSSAAAAMAAAMAGRPAASRGLGLSLPGAGFDFMPVSSGSPSPHGSSPTSTLLGHLHLSSQQAGPTRSSPEQPSSPRCQPAQRGQWTGYAGLSASAAQTSAAMSAGLSSSVAAINQANLRKQHLERLMSLPGIDLSQDPASLAAFLAQTTQQARMAQMCSSRLSPMQAGYPLPDAPSPAASLSEVIASLSNMDIRSASPLWLQAHLAVAAQQQQHQAAQMQAAAAEAAALASVQQARASPAMEAAFMAQHARRSSVHAPAFYWPEQNPCTRGMPSWEDAGSVEDVEPRRVESGAGIRHRIFERLLHGQDSAALAHSPSDPDLNSWVTDLLRGA